MRITVADQEHCKKELVIEFSSEEVKAETDKVAVQLARTVKVPGFRPGHVPMSVIKTRFKKDLSDQVLSQLMPRGFEDAVNKNDLNVLGQPSVSDVRHGTDGSIGVTFSFEVAPEFELSSYKGLPLVKKVYKVTDGDVDAAIERLRHRYAELAPVENRPSQTGDMVTTSSMTGRFLTEEDETADDDGGKADITESSSTIELGQEGLLADFNEAFTGVTAGDTKTFVVHYPKDYHSERFAGKIVRYRAEVSSINIKELPELDEDLVQLVTGEDKTIEDFRAAVRTDLEQAADARAKEELNGAAVSTLVDRNQFDLPGGLIESQITSRMNSIIRQLSRGGVDPRHLKTDWQSVRLSQHTSAERDLRASFILERVSEIENITVSDEELDKRIEDMAAGAGEDPAVLRARLTKENALDSMKAQVRNERALDLVIASADVRLEEVEEVDESNEAATKSGEGEQGA